MPPTAVKCSEITEPQYCGTGVFMFICQVVGNQCQCAQGVTETNGACPIPSTGPVILKQCSMQTGEKFCKPTVGCMYKDGKCVDDDGSSGGGSSGGGSGGGGDSSGGSGGDNTGSGGDNGSGSGSGGSGDNSTTGGNSSTNDTNKPSGDQGSSSASPLAILFIFALIVSVIACVTAAAVILKRKASRVINNDALVSTVAE